jgi:hypothetical protein
MNSRIKQKKEKQKARQLRLIQIEEEKKAAIKAERDKVIITKQIAIDSEKKQARRKRLEAITGKNIKNSETVLVPDFELQLKGHLKRIALEGQTTIKEYEEAW